MKPLISQLRCPEHRTAGALPGRHLSESCKSRRSPLLGCISRALCVGLVWVAPCCFCFAQNWEMFASKRDVVRADPELDRIRIPKLPIEHYPLLSKFKRLKEISFYWEGANDEKLRELSKLAFTNLQEVFLLDCPDVTDEGIRAIANFPSLRELGLEGTSITDAGLEVTAAKLNLIGVNVANCKGVTRKGIQRLASCPSLKELSFSADDWTQDEVIELMDSFKRVNWCGIIDPQKRLDAELLKARGKARGIQIVVKRTGALEGNREFRRKQTRH